MSQEVLIILFKSNVCQYIAWFFLSVLKWTAFYQLNPVPLFFKPGTLNLDLILIIFLGQTEMSRDLWFPTIRNFDKCRLRLARAASF